jgi:Disulphide bond corrector protein DsbC
MLALRQFAPGLIMLAALAAGQENPAAPSAEQSAIQDIPGRRVPSVSMAPVAVVPVTRGRSNPVNLHFRVSSGFHVNSNQPKSEFLIPTALKLSTPTDIIIGKVTYPAGSEMSFAFAPEDKVSVYTGEFPVVIEVRPLAEVIPAKYMIRGELKYQACDNAACYPPKKLPVQFEIKVVKPPPPPRKNPGQSPHVHL